MPFKSAARPPPHVTSARVSAKFHTVPRRTANFIRSTPYSTQRTAQYTTQSTQHTAHSAPQIGQSTQHRTEMSQQPYQDWDTIVFRKKQQNLKGEGAARAAVRNGTTSSAVPRASGPNKASDDARRLIKVENEDTPQESIVFFPLSFSPFSSFFLLFPFSPLSPLSSLSLSFPFVSLPFCGQSRRVLSHHPLETPLAAFISSPLHTFVPTHTAPCTNEQTCTNEHTVHHERRAHCTHRRHSASHRTPATPQSST